jgi:hypothetical protein
MAEHDTGSKGGTVSVDDGSLDQMVEAASVPNLAALFQAGKKAGLLKPTTGYGENA